MTMRQRKNFRVIGPGNPSGHYCMTLRWAKRVAAKWTKNGHEAFVQESYGENKWQTMEYLEATQ